MRRGLAEQMIDVSEFSKNLAAVMREVQARPIGVLKNKKIQAYFISADAYESILARLDDLDLMTLIHSRSQEVPVPVKLEAL